MTLDKLDQYLSRQKETRTWRSELDELQHKEITVKDVVRGSSDEFPYTAHPISIAGKPTKTNRIRRREERLKRRLEELEAEREEIDDFIDGLQDSQLRQIIHYRYIKGCSWTKTAQMIGGNNSSSAVRMRVSRYFKNDVRNVL